MDKTLTDAAVKALDALIDAELHTDDPSRYARIVKLCKHANDLVQLAATRVKQVIEQDYQGAVMHVGGANIYAAENNDVGDNEELVMRPAAGPLQVAAAYGGNATLADFTREVIGAFRESQQSKTPTTIDELQNVLDVRERLKAARMTIPDVIDRKIEALTAKMEQEDADAARPDVVRPELLRGHQAGADGDRLPADRGGALGEGEGSAVAADEGSCREAVGARGH